MRKPMQTKKAKVPKITEAEYIEYISHLREGGDRENASATKTGVMENKIQEK